jgi:hypothetical protein
MEVMTGPYRPWDDLHHISYFFLELKIIEVGEFVTTMNVDSPCPINALDMHEVYAEGIMESIPKMIPINISKTPGILENVCVGADCYP